MVDTLRKDVNLTNVILLTFTGDYFEDVEDSLDNDLKNLHQVVRASDFSEICLKNLASA